MVSITAKYAVRSLVELAALPPQASLAGRELAAAAGIPRNYLAKVLHVLGGAGLIHAARGIGGGYRLQRAPDQVRLIDIVELVDRARGHDDCLLDGLHPCSDATACAAHESWCEVKHAFRAFLEETTLAELVSRPAAVSAVTKHYLGTHSNRIAEELAKDSVREVTWHDKVPTGKMDLVVDLNFRMDTSALYSDIVLPAASWYEKADLNSTDLHSFIHPLSAAVPPCWESRSDW
jgi:Rrf2 family protein